MGFVGLVVEQDERRRVSDIPLRIFDEGQHSTFEISGTRIRSSLQRSPHTLVPSWSCTRKFSHT